MVSCLIKVTTIPVGDPPSFKDPMNKKLKALSQTMFALSGSALNMTFLAQALADQFKSYQMDLSDMGVEQQTVDCMHQMVLAGHFRPGTGFQLLAFMHQPYVDTKQTNADAQDTLAQVLDGKAGFKKILPHMSFVGDCLFGASLDKLVKRVTISCSLERARTSLQNPKGVSAPSWISKCFYPHPQVLSGASVVGHCLSLSE